MKPLIKRRDYLITITGFIGYSAFANPLITTYSDTINKQPSNSPDMRLRPHHIIDIVTDHGKNVQFEPHPYGHSNHIVAQKILSDLDIKVELVLEADDICKGCKYLQPDGSCTDVLAQLNPSPAKQAYNDVLDSRLFDHLLISPGTEMTIREYLGLINEKTPGIESICTHPKEDPETRLTGLMNGLGKLGIREVV